jgi:hypothetical protein
MDWIGLGHQVVQFLSLADSKSMNCAILRDAESTKIVQSWTIAPTSLNYRMTSGPFVDIVSPLGYRIRDDWSTRGGDINLYRTQEVHIVVEHIDPSQQPYQSYPIHLPLDTQIRAIQYTPNGDRIAWLLKFTYELPITRMLHRFIPAIKSETVSHMELRVSNLDGSNMHSLGYVMTMPDSLNDTEPHSLEWTRDGKNVSFIYQNVLWTVAAE